MASAKVIFNFIKNQRNSSPKVKDFTDRPPVLTKMAHLLPDDFEAVDFEDGTPTGTF